MMKKFLCTFLVAIFAFSVITIPASAASGPGTVDSTEALQWTAKLKYDSTTYRTKYMSGPTYFVTINNSLPVGGYDIQTMYAQNMGTPTSPYFTIADYYKHTIQHNRNVVRYGVCLHTHYPEERWSWGNVTIKWSPDFDDTDTGVHPLN